MGVDFETLSAERGFARGILQRLTGLKGCKGTLQAGFGIGTELHMTVHQDIGARSTEQVVKQGKGRGLSLGKARQTPLQHAAYATIKVFQTVFHTRKGTAFSHFMPHCGRKE